MAGPKVSAERREEIRRLYAAGGISQQGLANQFGIHQRTVCDIVKGLAPATRRPRVMGVRTHSDMELLMRREDAARLAKLIPEEDTRSLTAFICGDPIPGDRRRQA